MMLELKDIFNIPYTHYEIYSRDKYGRVNNADFMLSYNEEISGYNRFSFNGDFIEVRFRNGIINVYINNIRCPSIHIVDIRKIVCKNIDKDLPINLLKNRIIHILCRIM